MTQPIHPMLERVARAIARQQFPVDAPTINKRGWVERHWRLYLDHARAAIQALLEPDEGMLEAGITAMRDCVSLNKIARVALTEVHAAMLKPLLGDEG